MIVFLIAQAASAALSVWFSGKIAAVVPFFDIFTVFVHFAVERRGGGGREPRRVHSFLTREPETRARLVRVATRDKTRVVEFTRYCGVFRRLSRRLD